jgi:hypothetical protein
MRVYGNQETRHIRHSSAGIPQHTWVKGNKPLRRSAQSTVAKLVTTRPRHMADRWNVLVEPGLDDLAVGQADTNEALHPVFGRNPTDEDPRFEGLVQAQPSGQRPARIYELDRWLRLEPDVRDLNLTLGRQVGHLDEEMLERR